MNPGERKRNIAVGIGYFVLISVVLAVPWILVLTIPITAAYAVVKNYGGTADRLRRLPGIEPGGGMKVAAVAVLYGIGFMVLVGTGLGALAGPPSDPAASTTPTSEATPSTVTTEVTLTAGTTQSAVPTSQASTATDSPSPTAAARGPQEGTAWTVTITRVIDGDTVEARFPNDEVDTLRLLGVDTPETALSQVDPAEFEGIPDTTAGRDHLFNWGETASEYTTNQLNGETVRIEVDPQSDRRGSFGRLLVYIYIDGENFNKRLIDDGYARVYESSFSQRAEFEAAEAEAQANDVGLWAFETSTPTPTATPTSTSTPTPTPTPTATEEASGDGELVITDAQYDAPGDDHENLNEEYIVFENTGDAPLDMGGWTVSDVADHVYTVPSGFTLDPGETVTLYTGSGSNTDSELYWGSGRAIWNNGGDTVYVMDGGDVVLEESY